CSVSSAQIEPNAGKWKTWVLTSGDQLRLPPPPDEAATRAEIAQLKDIPNPQSPSYPSEHATVAGAASTVLAYLFPDKADDFKARAEEAAQVRVQAGL